MTTAAVLYIFSGVHFGARIELQEGVWEIGCDDACDLILSGLAPHHARITIAVADGEEGVRCTVASLEGAVFLDGKEISGETIVPAGSPWYLGETCIAWNRPDVEQKPPEPTSFLDAANGRSSDEDRDGSRDEDTEESSGGDEGGSDPKTEAQASQEKEVDAADTQDAGQTEASESLVMQVPERKGFFDRLVEKLRQPLPLVLLALLLGALSLVFSTDMTSSEYPNRVRELLEKERLQGLSVRTRSPGVEVRGSVAKPSDLKRLERAVQMLSFPVYLEVKVDDDMIRAVEDCLGVQGFYPLVDIERSGDSVHIVVKTYMRDPLVEADAFARLERDFPSPPDKRRQILHQEDVSSKISEVLSSSGLKDISPVYLPGRVLFTGTVVHEKALLVTRIQNSLSRFFGVPLFGEGNFRPLSKKEKVSEEYGQKLVLKDQSPVSGNTKDAVKKGEAEKRDNPLAGVVVTAVYRAPISFVATEDGRRFFIGAVLPSGYVIEAISTDTLQLRRGDTVMTYRLRGNNE